MKVLLLYRDDLASPARGRRCTQLVDGIGLRSPASKDKCVLIGAAFYKQLSRASALGGGLDVISAL